MPSARDGFVRRRPHRLGLGVAATAAVALGGPALAQDAPPIVGDPIQISRSGEDGDARVRPTDPELAYNPVDDQFLAVWIAPVPEAGATNPSRTEIRGQLLDADGEVAPDDFAVSVAAGANILTGLAVAHHEPANEYLVAWAEAPFVANAPFDIWVQRVTAGGDLVGDPAQISEMGSLVPLIAVDVASNPVADEYLVVWAASDESFQPPLARFETEVYGQRLSGAGEELGESDFRISAVLGDGETGWPLDVDSTAIAYNELSNEYLVVWAGIAYVGDEVPIDEFNTYLDREQELFGQRLDASGAPIGADGFLISADELPGPPAEPLPATLPIDQLDELTPNRSDVFRHVDVAFHRILDEYLAVWAEDGEDNGLAPNEREVFSRRIGSGGEPAGPKVRVTDHGPAGDASFSTFDPAVTVDPTRGRYLVVYAASDTRSTGDPTDPATAGGPAPVIRDSEIHGLFLDETGSPVAPEPIRLSDTGPPGDPAFDADRPVVATDASGRHRVVWFGNQTGFGSEEIPGLGRLPTILHETEVFTTTIEEPAAPAPTTTEASTTVPPATTTAAPVTEPPPAAEPPPDTAPTEPATTEPAASSDGGTDGGDDGSGAGPVIVLGGAALLAVTGVIVALARRRRSGTGD